MIILRSRLCQALQAHLTHKSNNPIYIHLKDHQKKINPQQSKLNLSFMSPSARTDIVPQQKRYDSKLSKKVQKDLDKKIFEDYKLKILEGEIDVAEQIEPDPLWGEEEKPVHYYKNISRSQVTWLSHSEVMDLQQMRQQLVEGYFAANKHPSSIEECLNLDDLADLAADYRLNGDIDRAKFYAIQQKIGNKFHLLSNRSLILLKFGFQQTPKMGTPTFNKILNDLLTEALPELNKNDLVQLFYANRFDAYRFGEENLQKNILRRLTSHYSSMTLSEKIDWFFLYIDSRSPTIRPQAHNRHWNQIRNVSQSVLYQLDLDEDLSSLSEAHALKLAYSLIRCKSNKAEHITESLVNYVEKALQNQALSSRAAILFFIYFSEINGNKSIENQELMATLKDVVTTCWEEHDKIYQLRALFAMVNLSLYDEAAHELYTNVELEADNTQLGYFCRLELMNSSGRQWQVMHLLAQLEHLPLRFFQDYKRFYNYVRVTAPEWDLEPIQKKLENTEGFFNSERLESLSMDKTIYSNIKKFQKFSQRKTLPREDILVGVPIKNVQYADFAISKYQISVDIITKAERIPQTTELKGWFMAKVKSLENVGWRHLYVFEEDLAALDMNELFDYLHSVCEPYFEEQLEVIAAAHEYKADQLEHLRNERYWKLMKGQELEAWMNDPEGQAKKEAEQEDEDQKILTSYLEEGDHIMGDDSKAILMAELKRYNEVVAKDK